MTQLLDLGWSSSLEAHLENLDIPGLVPGRIVADAREIYRVRTADGETFARPAGRLRAAAAGGGELPVAGDWVALRVAESEGDALVVAILPRRSRLARRAPGTRPGIDVLAANVDTAFLVVSLEGEPNLRRLERTLVMTFEGGVSPVVLLTKADLAHDPEESVRLVAGAAPGVPVHAISAVDGTGLEALGPYLGRGRTIALLGPSGAGKSTLVNRLFGAELLATGSLRAGDTRGRHTTTARHLVPLPGGALLLDTPGLREIALLGEAPESPFVEIEELSGACRFRDCRHQREPGCAVREAAGSGALDPGRLASFHKLSRELQWVEERERFGSGGADRRRWKRIMERAR